MKAYDSILPLISHAFFSIRLSFLPVPSKPTLPPAPFPAVHLTDLQHGVVIEDVIDVGQLTSVWDDDQRLRVANQHRHLGERVARLRGAGHPPGRVQRHCRRVCAALVWKMTSPAQNDVIGTLLLTVKLSDWRSTGALVPRWRSMYVKGYNIITIITIK